MEYLRICDARECEQNVRQQQFSISVFLNEGRKERSFYCSSGKESEKREANTEEDGKKMNGYCVRQVQEKAQR